MGTAGGGMSMGREDEEEEEEKAVTGGLGDMGIGSGAAVFRSLE